MSKRFPTDELAQPAWQTDWQKTVAFDPTISTEFASGDVATRPMFTALLYQISFSYRYLSAADLTIIENYQEHVVVGASEFTIREYRTDLDWSVRLLRPILVTAEDDFQLGFKARIELFGKQVEKMNITQIDVEDLGAGVDITDRPVFYNPRAVTINSIAILTQGAPAGVDDSNTSVILVEDDASNQVVSKTYNTATQPPSSDGEDLGTITNGSLLAAEHLMLSVTNGATANLPAFTLTIEWYYTT